MARLVRRKPAGAADVGRVDLAVKPLLTGNSESGYGPQIQLRRNLHLAEIAKIVAPRAHAVLLVDQTGWHMSTHLTVPPNITIIALPPKSPELNPVENVWQFMRDNWLSNRIFKSYDDLVDHRCQAWNKAH